MTLYKRPSIKDVRSQGGGEFVQCGHFSDKRGRGVLHMQTSTLFGTKNFGFSKIYSVSARAKEGFVPVRTFCEQGGRGSIFRDFVRTSFMDDL